MLKKAVLGTLVALGSLGVNNINTVDAGGVELYLGGDGISIRVDSGHCPRYYRPHSFGVAPFLPMPYFRGNSFNNPTYGGGFYRPPMHFHGPPVQFHRSPAPRIYYPRLPSHSLHHNRFHR